MSDLALALAAGLVAAVNPCGFALLPVYLSLLVIGDDSPARLVAVRRALAATAAMTLGFVAVFGLFGIVIAPAASAVQRWLPWFTVGFGLVLIVAGVWLVAGRELPSFGLKPTRGPVVTRKARAMVLFGAAYALASLSCTIAPFLAIVAGSFRADSLLAGVGLFIAYAVGMGLLVGAAALAVALARPSAVRRLRRAGPALSRISGLVLVVAGAYVAYYGWYELRGAADDPVISAAQQVQGWMANTLDRLGAPVVAIAFVVLLGAGALAGLIRQRRTVRSGS